MRSAAFGRPNRGPPLTSASCCCSSCTCVAGRGCRGQTRARARLGWLDTCARLRWQDWQIAEAGGQAAGLAAAGAGWGLGAHLGACGAERRGRGRRGAAARGGEHGRELAFAAGSKTGLSRQITKSLAASRCFALQNTQRRM
jgi:hypothetical protein